MDDRQIQRLVQMALEAEALESAESSGAFVLAAHRSRWRSPARWSAAAAAVLVGAACVWLALPQRLAPVAPIAVRPAEATAPRVASHEPGRMPSLAPITTASPEAEPAAEHTVVMTIFRDSYGELSCVEWHPHEWGEGRTLAEVSTGELLDAGAHAWCDSGASEMLVVALSGPSGSMPSTDTVAQDLAACIAGSDDPCDLDSAAISCLPPGVQAVTHSVPLPY